ncbi:hypothetical protein Q3G72_001772 [Acer saccharum]|nr:hypothetical protein Q3G72_001772 [Acer saccharum]
MCDSSSSSRAYSIWSQESRHADINKVAEIECTRRRSARSSEEIRRRPEIYLRLNLKLDAKELLSLRSLVDSHEGGHILVGYSIGVLPTGYMVPSIEALRQRKFTVARVEFMVLSSLKKSPFQGC